MQPSERDEPAGGYLYRIFRATEEENRRVILGLLDRDPQARLLDLGCYDGELTQRLASQIGTSNICGVEVLPVAAQAARTKGIHTVETNLNGPIPLPSGSFDVVHANQVIEHLYDTDVFASEIYRLLSPEGYAIISTNNLASAHNILSLIFGRQPPPAHVSGQAIVGNAFNPLEGGAHENTAMAHLRIFSYVALRDFLGYHGLRCEQYRTVGFYPLPIPVARVATRFLPIYGAFLTCRVRRK
jgi:SAM-dependent methyltransferase